MNEDELILEIEKSLADLERLNKETDIVFAKFAEDRKIMRERYANRNWIQQKS